MLCEEKVVFTATTGRSGTKTLATLLSKVPDCIALHEPYPEMCGAVLRAQAFGNKAFVDKVYWRIKSINILRSAVGFRYYIEANHCFIKTFNRQAIEDFGERLAVIHLVRPAIDVAMSIFRLQESPGTEIGNHWWLDYRSPENLIQVADLLDGSGEFACPFYRALWYWYEMETRIAEWCTKLPTLKIARFETHWLNDKDRVFKLLDNLEIAYDKSRLEPIVGQRKNERDDRKLIAELPAREARAMLSRFQGLLTDRGVDIAAIDAINAA